VHKYIIFLFLTISFSASELIAQNLNLKTTGATDYETEIIENFNYKKKHIDLKSILNEVDLLQEKIIKAGYIESEYSSEEKINDSVFKIEFKLKNKYDNIIISYNSSDINKKIINSISKNNSEGIFTVPFIKIEQVLEFINTQLINNGYPFTKTKLTNIKIKNNKTLTANINIYKGEAKRGLDNIVVKGYEKFPKSYLKHFLKIKPEKTFKIETIKKKLNTLNNLRFAEQIQAPEVLFTKDSTTLYIYLKKSQSNTFDGYLGFSTDENTNTIDFNGYLNLNLNNNLNYGESFKLLYRSNENEDKNFEVNLSLPYLFNTAIGTEVGLKIFKKDSSFTTVNQKMNLFYQLNAKNRVYAGIETINSNNLINNELSLTVNDYKSNLYTSRYIFENRENSNKLFQIKTYINLEFAIGSRTLALKKENQNRIQIDASHILYLNKKNSFYTRINGALLNSKSYLENELFRFGGINSIRGFQENSIVASKYLLLNTEYRYKLSNNIYAHTVIDFANFENKIINTQENLYGFGLGFGIITKAGLLKFNFANGKTETQNFKFSNSKIHLSLVSIF